MEKPHHGLQPPHDLGELRLRRLMAAMPGEARLHALLGLHLLSQGRKRQARAAIEDALRLDPRLAYAHFLTSIIACGSHSMWRIRRGLNRSIAQAREAIRLDPDEATYQEWLSEILLIRQSLSFGRRFAREALDAADGALRLDPQNARAYLLRARALGRLKQRQASTVAFREARTLAPESPEIARAFGLHLARLGDFSGAEAQLGDALRFQSDSRETLRALRLFHMRRRLSEPFLALVTILRRRCLP